MTGTRVDVNLKCVLCGHKFTVPLTTHEPMCPMCYGPVVVEKILAKGLHSTRRIK